MLSNEDSVQPKTEKKKKKKKRLQGVMKKSERNITQPKYYNNLSVTNPPKYGDMPFTQDSK